MQLQLCFYVSSPLITIKLAISCSPVFMPSLPSSVSNFLSRQKHKSIKMSLYSRYLGLNYSFWLEDKQARGANRNTCKQWTWLGLGEQSGKQACMLGFSNASRQAECCFMEPSGSKALQAHRSGKVMLILCKGCALCPCVIHLHFPRPKAYSLVFKLSTLEDAKLKNVLWKRSKSETGYINSLSPFPLNWYDSLHSQQQQLTTAAEQIHHNSHVITQDADQFVGFCYKNCTAPCWLSTWETSPGPKSTTFVPWLCTQSWCKSCWQQPSLRGREMFFMASRCGDSVFRKGFAQRDVTQ